MGRPVEHPDLLPEVIRAFMTSILTALRALEGFFQMVPGFRSFQSVSEGELPVQDGVNEVRAPLVGWLLMPLYQPSGGDGSFLARTA
jgi:hypothetical protein